MKMAKQVVFYKLLTLLILTVHSTSCQFISSGPMPFQQHQPPLNSPYFYDEPVDINTQLGHVIGKTVYLFDGPNRSPFERLSSQLYAPPNTWQRPMLPNYYKNVSIFLGIPYARPPIRENGLRFQLPQPMTHWGNLAADKYRPACPQPHKYTGQDRLIASTDEDCLYLNIFTPYAKPRSSRLFPVIMHIHGGRYEHGSGNSFPGHMLAASQEVVVVTFNYRLGVLGFMATADNSSAGNYGLADQLAAIQWVRDHIENFNGDPQLITLWGTGAGAASAGLLAISPRSKDLIKRVIAQSGSASADWAFQKNPLFIRNTSIVIGEHFGCFTRDSYSLIKCLESRSFNEFTTVEVESEVGWLPFSPVSDYKTRDRDFALIPDTPDQFFQLQYMKFSDGFAYMSGVTRDEGSAWLLEDEEANVKNYIVDEEFFRRKSRSFLKVFNVTLNQPAMIDAIDFMYSPWNDRKNLSNYRQGYIDMLTDAWVVAGHDKIVKSMLQKRIPTYAYVLNYTVEGLVQPEPWMGVPHDTEYFLLSGAPFMDAKYFPSIYNLKEARWTEMDRNMSQFFMEAYANFAKYGNPTPYSLFNSILWDPVRVDNLQYLSVNTTNFTSIMRRDYRLKSAQFWNDYIYSILSHEPVYWTYQFSPVDMELRAYKASTYTVIVLSIILLFLSLLCSCLYCRARRERYGDTSIDYMPVPNESGVLLYGPPSKRVNSQTMMKLPVREPKSAHFIKQFRTARRVANEFRIKGISYVKEIKTKLGNWLFNFFGGSLNDMEKLAKFGPDLQKEVAHYEKQSKGGKLEDFDVDCDMVKLQIKVLHSILFILQSDIKFLIMEDGALINRAIYETLKANKYVVKDNFYETVNPKQRDLPLKYYTDRVDQSSTKIVQGIDHFEQPGEFVLGRLLKSNSL